MSTFLEVKVVVKDEVVEMFFDNDYEDWSGGNIGSVRDSLDASFEENLIPALTYDRRRYMISFTHPFPGMPVERTVKAILEVIVKSHSSYCGVIIWR